MIHRHQIGLDNELMLKKVLIVLCSGYFVAVGFIFIYVLNFEKSFLFLCMISLCPFMQVLISILKRYEYKGDISILVLSIMLNSLGLVILYRLDISSGWFVTRAAGYEGSIPMALKQLIFSMIAMLGVVTGLAKGYFKKAILFIEKKKNIMIWGIASFALLALPKLLGGSIWLTQDRSIQPSEFVFKITFLIFLSKYYESKATELLLQHYPFKEIAKIVLFIVAGIGCFFLAPMVLMQHELGTALLIALSFIFLTTYVSDRLSFLFVGLAFIILAMALGVLVSDHIERRVLAAWLEWKDYAFKPFGEGKLYPGYQIFQALAAIKLSPWGMGIGNGILKHATMNRTIVPVATSDFIAIPLGSELGIIGIAIVCAGYLVILNKSLPKNRTLNFQSIFAAGIAIALSVQGCFNLSEVVALLPITGIPLPHLSYGGSAVLANYILTGILLTILGNRSEDKPK
jgi:cell division protein FtsW (lipid II flippase)